MAHKPHRKVPRTLPRARPLSKRKRLWFQTVALLLPLLLLGLIEISLRLCGFGGYPTMMQRLGQVSDQTLVIADQGGAASWFFANPFRAGITEQHAFLDPKPTNTTRIFLVGESAIKGYPEPRNLASSSFLEQMLRDVLPERKVEVINLGTTAIASFPVLGILTEALDYEPDLMVIYTGNNEFFGTYGVGSSGRAGGKPWMLSATRALHSLALVQVLDALLYSRRSDSDRTLMEAMVGQSYLGPDDWRRAAAANNLHHNLTEMIRRCRSRGVPVLVCTQPGNERGLAPMGAENLASMPPAQRDEIKALLAAVEARPPANPKTNQLALERILELYPDHARAHFLLGEVHARAGRQPEALAEFVRARDLDPMPWRTPTLSQNAILTAAREQAAPVCDLEKIFRAASPGGAIGWELMDDHVHPSLRGQALIAQSLLECLTNFSGHLHVLVEALESLPSGDDYARRLGDNIYDRYGVAFNMRTLFAVPFMRTNNPAAFERLNRLVEGIEQQMPRDVREVMREWQASRPFEGAKCPVTAAVAQLKLKRNEYREALDLFTIAQQGVPEYTSWYLEYTYYTLLCKQKLKQPFTPADNQQAQSAIEQGRFLFARDSSGNDFTARYTGLLCLLQNQFAEAIPFLEAARPKLDGFDLAATDQALIVCYLQTRQFEQAEAIARNGVANGGEFADRYRALLDSLPALESSLNAGTNPPVTAPE
jgi:tetratricopeptide (TPR) repeat protein